MGSMARHSLAARSLRHLRFARRIMVGQPLLAHASRDSRPNHQLTYIALGGRQLALGHVLRHLPRPVASQVDDIAADAPALAASDASESFNTAPPASRVSDGAATLRLVPPPFPAAPGVAPAEPAAKAEKRPGGTSARTSGANEMMVEAAASAPHPARVDERRPRSRIIELPGIVVQPIENEGDEGDEGDGGGEGGGSDQRIANGLFDGEASFGAAKAPCASNKLLRHIVRRVHHDGPREGVGVCRFEALETQAAAVMAVILIERPIDTERRAV